MGHSQDNPTFEMEEGNSSFTNIDLSEGDQKSDGHNNNTMSHKMPIYTPEETKRMTKNIHIISLSFLALFTGFNSMSNLLSSLYPSGLGTYTNATVYGFLVLSSLFVPSFAMRQFSVKGALILSMFGYVGYMAAQYHPRVYTMLPAAAAVGICAAPLWASKSFYLTHVGNQYAELTMDHAEIIIIKFFGIFFLYFQSSQIWGNLISSTILSTGDKIYPNETQIPKCGFNFCPGDLQDNSKSSTDKTIYIYSGVCLACAFTAISVIAIFLDPLTRYGENERIASMKKKSGLDLLLATSMQMKNPYQMLIIPLTIFSGLEQGFLSTDFTQAFITCSWGVHNIGYVLICYGIVDAILSISFGPVVRKLGRVPVYTYGALANFCMIGVMIFYKPDPDKPFILFIIAGFWASADAVWQTQINSLYGVLFKSNEEAAFSNYRLFESIGFIIAYISGDLLCVKAKLIVLSTFLILGITGFYVIEYKEHARKLKLKDTINKPSISNIVEEKM